MNNILHLCASELDSKAGLVATLTTIDQVAQQLGIDFFVIGATARDLILEHGAKAPADRATRDVDFAVQVAYWAQFEALKTALLEQGFSASRQSQHQLTDGLSRFIDILPFGPIAEHQQLAWPPGHDVIMSVVGFDEAFQAAISVHIDELETPLVIRVASVAGIALLKLVAWQERDPLPRRNDAQDIAYLCQHYHRVDSVLDALYEQQIMARFDFHIETASGYKLGLDAAALSQPSTRQNIQALLDRPFEDKGFDRLVAEAISQNRANETLTRAVLDAFKQGFLAV